MYISNARKMKGFAVLKKTTTMHRKDDFNSDSTLAESSNVLYFLRQLTKLFIECKAGESCYENSVPVLY